MTFLQGLLLGILQGLTEFLPVSSSGHLVLAEHLLNVQNSNLLSFDVFVHFGTLISVCIIFRKDIVEISLAFYHALRTKTFRSGYQTNDYFRLGVVLIIGTIPAGYVGITFHDQVAEAFQDSKLVAVDLILTGLILFLTRFTRGVEPKRLGVISGFIIGMAQSIAILPGISRSGLTISSGLFLRLSPALAARFSFLLSIPVIAGAALLESRSALQQGIEMGFTPFVVGMIAAAITGYFAIKFVLRIIERGRFSWFAFYCFAVGIAGILFV